MTPFARRTRTPQSAVAPARSPLAPLAARYATSQPQPRERRRTMTDERHTDQGDSSHAAEPRSLAYAGGSPLPNLRGDCGLSVHEDRARATGGDPGRSQRQEDPLSSDLSADEPPAGETLTDWLENRGIDTGSGW